MSKDIQEMISKCQICQTRKYSGPTKLPMRETTTSGGSFERLFIDLIGPLPVSHSNNQYILTIQDDLTKFLEAIAINDKKSDTVARVLVEQFFLKYMFPKFLVSDSGSEFKCELLKSICNLLKINPIYSAPYHHETIGALENSHRSLRSYLRSFADDDKFNWDLWLPYYAYSYNSTIHESTGYTPFELVFGQNNSISPEVNLNKTWYNIDDYASELRYRLKISLDEARQRQINIKNKRVENYNSKHKTKEGEIKVGDKILVKNNSSDKLEPIWLGPYLVNKIENDNIFYKIKNALRQAHINNVKKFKQ